LLIRKHWVNAEVDIAQSAEDALMQLGSVFYDVMLVDMRMPGMDGPTLTRRVRTSERVALRNMPIIALTGNSHEKDRQACLESGMNDVLIKPLDPATLKRAFVDHLREIESDR
jgi:CheY-like chemotaxis protein